MKYVIYPERGGEVVASSEDANYPDANLSDDYRQSVWKAASGTQTATITIPIAAVQSSLGAVAVFGTNAASGTMTVTDTVTSAVLLNVALTISHGRVFKTFTPTANALSAVVSLTTTATTIEAGIARAGDVTEIRNPQFGITEGWEDFSIRKKLRNGSLYTKHLNKLRTFSYSMLLSRESEFRRLMDVYDYFGPDPCAMLLASGTGQDERWAVFGAFTPPSGSHKNVLHTPATVSILEAA